MVNVDFIFGATFPCSVCGKDTAHGVVSTAGWISLCKVCALAANPQDFSVSECAHNSPY